MKRLLIFLALLFATPASAGVVCSVPFNLQNGTTADATQVMANYNALVTCFGNAAAAGVNNDITALSALTTPITTTQGGTPVYVGVGTSTGSANAQAVTSTTPTTFSLTMGNQVTFVAGLSNTAAMTLNVASSGAKNLYRLTQLGAVPMVGGEILAGQVVTAIYDGNQYQCMSCERAVIGEGRDWFTSTPPTGWLLRDGTSYLRTDYPALFSVIGTTYGSADAAHFSVPDERARMSFVPDTAGRVTGLCAAAATLGTVCGNAGGTTTIAQTNLPNVNFNVTIPSGQGSHTHGTQVDLISVSGPGGLLAVAGINPSGGSASGNVLTQTLPGMTGTAASGGAGTGFSVLNGSIVVNKIIKY